jgi:hypothetical protein
MPSITIYQQMDFDDKIGIASFLQAHAARHSMYSQISTTRGLQFANTNLTPYPDDDWFQRHYVAHNYLQSFINSNTPSGLSELTDYDWSDQDNFSQWMQLHTVIHQQIDQALGIE